MDGKLRFLAFLADRWYQSIRFCFPRAVGPRATGEAVEWRGRRCIDHTGAGTEDLGSNPRTVSQMFSCEGSSEAHTFSQPSALSINGGCIWVLVALHLYSEFFFFLSPRKSQKLIIMKKKITKVGIE